MPYSKQSYEYTTGARTFTLALASGYDYESNISVYVEGELDGGGDQIFRDFTFDSEFVINVTDALDNPSTVVVLRTVSPTVFSVDFEAGADVTKRNLQLAFRQQFFLMQELLDGRVDGVDVSAEAIAAASSAAASAVSAAEAAASAALVDADEIILRDGSTDFTGLQTLSGAPTADLHAATKKYVDDTVGGGGSMLLDGSAQMTAAMLLVDAAPTAGNHATRKTYVDTALALKANKASGVFTGNPTAPTQSPGNDSTRLATTAFVKAATSIGGKLIDVSVFTGSGSWVPHADGTTALIFCTGGGGGGMGDINDSKGAGGAGGTAIAFVADTTGISSETVTIGAAGAQTSSGGTSSVGSLASAAGGNGSSNNFGASGGSATIGDMLIDGGGGGSGGGSSSGVSGTGGASFWGGGGKGASSGESPGGEAYGSGGAGGNGDGSTTNGGVGKAGVVLILEW